MHYLAVFQLLFYYYSNLLFMKIKTLIIVIAVGFITSCNSQQDDATTPETIETATPEILLEENTLSQSFSYLKSGRYKADIISRLYSEALEKDSALRVLNEKIEMMSSIKEDSLQAFNNYKSVNEDYWKSAKSYIDQIQDETLKTITAKAFDDLEKVFYAKITNHEQVNLTIQQKSIALQDRLLVMKLLVTQPMILNFQNNEFPDIKTMESLIEAYDALIQEAEKITQ